ncbi:MAG TPA: hypothetical protein VHE35_00740 [Kofleriaceae bacterium]|nr:hypothetical protein [Kofleriaceae bacterium]
MRTLLAALSLSTFALLGLAACETCPDGDSSGSLFCHAGTCADGETVCGGVCSNMQNDRDNCGHCGNQCGDGLVCAGGSCVEGCENNMVSCGGTCTDTMTDEANCGGCGLNGSQFVCDPGETCDTGACVCTSGVVCGGACTDPMTDSMHCGASGDCTGANTGTACQANEGCVGGNCVSRNIYRGSLKATTGRWTYQGMLGLAGANAECDMRWPGSQVCSFAKLQMASMRNPAETTNAMDYDGVAVTSWWIDDPTAVNNERCTKNADGIPWTYATQDEGHVGKYVTLTAATGAISALQTGVLPSCNGSRNVACCSTVVAP